MSEEPGLPVERFRLHGLRKLNWVERPLGRDYAAHLAAHGFDRWIAPGPLMIVVGPNGGGKSTTIDLFRSLGDAALLAGLHRENYGGEDFAGFDIEGHGFALSARFSKHTPEAAETFEASTLFLVGRTPDGDHQLSRVVPKFGGADPRLEDVQAWLDSVVRVPMRRFSPVGAAPGDELDDAALVDLLNELSSHFPSVAANPQVLPFRRYKGAAAGPGRVGVLFRDDPGQHGFVHRSTLPLGWLQLASILGFLRSCPPGALLLLDEPDRHLHPSLQRVLLEVIDRERQRLGAQVVLATHSSVLANPELGRRYGATLVVAARGRLERLPDERRVLDDLGVTSGDLIQANGLVWVEGPSDRLYIKAWLDRLAQARGVPPPIERVHFAFVSYGGALLKHLTLTDGEPNRIALRRINRNFLLVVDRDLPPDSSAELGAEKRRVLAEAQTLDQPDAVWVTEGYTIEDYLPTGWSAAARHVRQTEDGRTVVTGVSKVELATRFRDEVGDWRQSFREGSDLPVRMEALLDAIGAWQTPQEVIPMAYLPPFLR
jgi:ABC-type branched-subunit amino acid transport system ATPase component